MVRWNLSLELIGVWDPGGGKRADPLRGGGARSDRDSEKLYVPSDMASGG